MHYCVSEFFKDEPKDECNLKFLKTHECFSKFDKKPYYLTMSRRRRSEYRLVITEPEATNCFSIISVFIGFISAFKRLYL
jgi:hypothetical protein